MIRVFIADDHDIVRDGLRTAISDAPDMSVVGEVADATGIRKRLTAVKPDVLVLDVNMPGCGGPEAVRDIRTGAPAPQVVVFTMYNEDRHAVGFLRAGAAAFINKRRSTRELLNAIRRAAEGRQTITSDLEDYILENQIDMQKAPQDLLSARELEVVRLLAAGLRATEIADQQGLSTSTVNTFVQRAKEKLGVRTVVEVVQFARDNGLLG